MTTEAGIREAVHRADAAPDYPSAVAILIDAGVRTYITDVRTRTIVYSSDFASYTDRGEAPRIETETPRESFAPASIREALATLDRGETDYPGMLALLWQAGVLEYEVNLLAGQITFRSTAGETYDHRIDSGRGTGEA